METLKVNPDVIRVQNQIKSLLKAKGVSYRDLAKHLGLSESGVKKIMRGTDVSMHRLSQICKVLQISLVDFMQSLEHRRYENTQYTLEQQNHFLREPELFYFYWKLVFERCSLDAIMSELGVSSENINQMLLKLDKLNLIELGPGRKLGLPRLKAIRSFGDGKLIQKVYREWSYQLINKISPPDRHDKGFFLFRGLKMREESFQALVQALRDVEEEFINRGIREMKLFPNHELKPISWVAALLPESFVNLVRGSL